MRPETTAVAAAVVCHAHPRHGGMMHFKVVFRAAKALQRHGVAALRFNFRGVGRSDGSYDGGRGEQDDVKAALDELQRRIPDVPLVLGGFSFGSTMALRVGCSEGRVRAVFALGYPVSLTPDASFLLGCSTPRLFIQGENDAFGTGENLRRLVDRLPEPRRLVVVPGSDHFFSGHLDALQDVMEAWVASEPWSTAGAQAC